VGRSFRISETTRYTLQAKQTTTAKANKFSITNLVSWGKGQAVHAHNAFGTSSEASSKIFGGPNIFTLSEKQLFVWDTASQSTKRQDMLEIREGPWPFGPPAATPVW